MPTMLCLRSDAVCCFWVPFCLTENFTGTVGESSIICCAYINFISFSNFYFIYLLLVHEFSEKVHKEEMKSKYTKWDSVGSHDKGIQEES